MKNRTLHMIGNAQSDTWSHSVWSFREVVDRFAVTSMVPVAAGPVKAVMRVVSECGRSRIIQDFTLYAGRDQGLQRLRYTIPRAAGQPVREVNLLEWPLEAAGSQEVA